MCLSGYALAGSYVKTPTGGSLPKNPYGGTCHWDANSSAYVTGNGVYGYSQGDAGVVECEGTITTKYTWVPSQIADPDHPGQMMDDPLDTPPDEVISQETCSVLAQSWGTAGLYTEADNGLGFASTDASGSGWSYSYSTGTLYTKRSGGATITLTCTPYGIGISDAWDAWTSVNYSSSILVPKVTLTGTTRFASPAALAFLTGQQITGQVSGGLTVSSYAWSLEDTTGILPFKSYTSTAGTASSWLGTGAKVSHSAGDLTASSFSFYSIKSGTVKLKCDVVFTLPASSAWAGGLPNFTAKSWSFSSVRPTCASWTISDGIVSLGSTLQFGSGGGPGQAWSNVELTVPSPFSQVGQGGFAQLFNGDRFVHRTSSGAYPANFYKWPWNAVQTLDVSFPAPSAYAPTWNLPAKGSGSDSPYQGLSGNVSFGDMGGNLWDDAAASDALETWVMYKPPQVGSQGTCWIPMAHYTWDWSGEAARSGGVGSWSLISTPTGHGSNGDLDLNYTTFPTWSKTTPTPFWMYP